MEDESKMTLREYRRQAFLSMQDLADKAGVTTVTVWRIENNKHKRLTMKTMRAIAGALSVPPGDIREFAAESKK